MQPKANIIQVTETELIQEVLGYQGACGIIRMSDNKGLFSNSLITLASAAHPNDWLGKDMKSYWPDNEFERFQQALLQDGELPEFYYTAYLFDGRAAEFKVRARLVSFRDELCRCVKTIECNPIQ